MDLKHIFDNDCWQKTTNEVYSFALGVVVSCNDKVLILERSIRSFLPYRCEIPNDIVEYKDNVDIFDIAKKIVYEQSGIQIDKIDQYIKHFDYQRLDGSTTKMVVFSAKSLQLDSPIMVSSDFRFGTYISRDEIGSYNIISPFLDCILGFWSGFPTDMEFRNFLFSQAEKSGIWKYKIRFLICASPYNGILLLRRNRRKSMPLHFELLGSDWTRYDDFESIVENTLDQYAGLFFDGDNGYIGCYDYENEDGEKVREFFFKIKGHLKYTEIDILDHSEWIFVSPIEAQDLKMTPSCAKAMEILLSYSKENVVEKVE